MMSRTEADLLRQPLPVSKLLLPRRAAKSPGCVFRQVSAGHGAAVHREIGSRTWRAAALLYKALKHVDPSCANVTMNVSVA
eukprot:508517-Rhodomonas_salina.3